MRRPTEILKDAPLLGQFCRWLYGWATLRRQLDVIRSNSFSVAMELARLEGELRGKSPSAPEAARGGEAHPSAMTSRLCTQEQFLTSEYKSWCRELKEEPMWHRKQWEHYFISRALRERSVLDRGRKGCGFGVGREPLPAFFASLGCKILATDAPSPKAGRSWLATQQHAASLKNLRVGDICPVETFYSNVEYRPVDMNHIPADLADFDFIWSSCAMEHLGSLEKGIQFVLNSCRCLKPGGIAVHTTEFNLSSNDKTVEWGATVLFRQRDILELGRRLPDIGSELIPVDFSPGNGFLDKFIPPPPYDYSRVTLPMLKMMVQGYVSTSIGLILRKAEA
jgi:SAM-dependent methyltransferase